MQGQYGARTTIHGAAKFDGWAIADGWGTDGRKIFRPYNRGVGANWAGATIYGAAIIDGWANGYRWHT